MRGHVRASRGRRAGNGGLGPPRLAGRGGGPRGARPRPGDTRARGTECARGRRGWRVASHQTRETGAPRPPRNASGDACGAGAPSYAHCDLCHRADGRHARAAAPTVSEHRGRSPREAEARGGSFSASPRTPAASQEEVRRPRCAGACSAAVRDARVRECPVFFLHRKLGLQKKNGMKFPRRESHRPKRAKVTLSRTQLSHRVHQALPSRSRRFSLPRGDPSAGGRRAPGRSPRGNVPEGRAAAAGGDRKDRPLRPPAGGGPRHPGGHTPGVQDGRKADFLFKLLSWRHFVTAAPGPPSSLRRAQPCCGDKCPSP